MAQDPHTLPPRTEVKLIGPSGTVYRGVLGFSGPRGIELYREGRDEPCLFPAESVVLPAEDPAWPEPPAEP